jgi:hypothetical protein
MKYSDMELYGPRSGISRPAVTVRTGSNRMATTVIGSDVASLGQ